jgi:DNA polymerase III delta prime subunit
MNFSSHFQPLTNAYLVEGTRMAIEKDLLEVLMAMGILVIGNPDFWVQHYATFTIEDAREVKDSASKKKMSEGKRVFIIFADSITREASNALLKTLEEPGEGTHFFLVMPSVKRVLPTILSRVRVVKHSSNITSVVMDPLEFLSLSPPERMKKIKEILVRLEKEEISKGDIQMFIEELLRSIYEGKKGKSLEKEAAAVSYSRDQSASVKMILEYLALIV